MTEVMRVRLVKGITVIMVLVLLLGMAGVDGTQENIQLASGIMVLVGGLWLFFLGMANASN